MCAPNENATVDPANCCNDDCVQILWDFFFNGTHDTQTPIDLSPTIVNIIYFVDRVGKPVNWAPVSGAMTTDDDDL